jgi:transcriptional regulator with XRE-family HTH domain
VNHSSIQTAFGKAVRGLREQRGMSQERVASLCEIDRSYFGSVERGERNVSLTNIVRIAGALGVMPSELLARMESVAEPEGDGPP